MCVREGLGGAKRGFKEMKDRYTEIFWDLVALQDMGHCCCRDSEEEDEEEE